MRALGDEAHWQDRDLYHAVDAPPALPEGAFLGNGTFALDHLRVGAVHWTPEGNGTLHARLHAGADESAVARDARTLLQAATRLDPDAIEDRVAALLASRNETTDARGVGVIVFAVPQRASFEPFVPVDGDVEPTVTVGAATASFEAAVKMTSLNGRLLTVDAFGEARMSHPWGEVEEAAVLADVRATLLAHGLPAPVQLQTSGSVC